MVSFGLLLFVVLNSGIWAPFLFRPQRLRIIFSTCVTAIFDPCSLAESCRCPQDCFAVGDFAAAIDASRYCADHAAPLCCCGIMSDGGYAVWIVIRHQPYRIVNCENLRSSGPPVGSSAHTMQRNSSALIPGRRFYCVVDETLDLRRLRLFFG